MRIRIAKIPYLNAAPFYVTLDQWKVPMVEMPPRQLGDAARRGEIDAAPLSLFDYLGLQEQFEPVGDYIIGVKKAAGSVLVFSREPFDRLTDDSTVDLTVESATGARLAKMILAEKFHVKPRYVSGDESATARLLIGDEALVGRLRGIPDYPHVLDLGQAWWDWHHLPFVFAVWGVRRSQAQEEKHKLKEFIDAAMRVWADVSHREALVELMAGTAGFEPRELNEYFSLLTYRKGPDETEAIEIFQLCLQRLESSGVLAK